MKPIVPVTALIALLCSYFLNINNRPGWGWYLGFAAVAFVIGAAVMMEKKT